MDCQLVRRHVEGSAGPTAAVLIALHAEGADLDELVPLCRRAAPELELCAPQGPRSCNPLLGSGHAGARWGAYLGYGWFRHDDDRRPEPATLGDSLAQLEQLAGELSRERAPLLAVGHREGDTLARELERRVPGLLAGVYTVSSPSVAHAPALRRWIQEVTA